MSVVAIVAFSGATTVKAFSRGCTQSWKCCNSRVSRTASSTAARSSALSSTSSNQASETTTAVVAKKRVAIIGGGLAGLSTAYHLLCKTTSSSEQPLELTIFDTRPVGTGGASAIAGGLLHPLSPSGKLVYLGLEGLEASNQLLNAACLHLNDGGAEDSTIVLQDSVYRVALTLEQQTSLQALAVTNRDALEACQVQCQWLSPDEMNAILDDAYPPTTTTTASPRNHFGALKLSGNARVIHVPCYLRGLWKACCHLSNHTAQWIVTDPDTVVNHKDWLERLQNEYDVVVLAAGAGLFQAAEVGGSESSSQSSLPSLPDAGGSTLLSPKDFPIQLVRGQSVEMQRRRRGADVSPTPITSQRTMSPPALVCGKYVLPTLRNDRILVGATHEFQAVPWTLDKVLEELRLRTMDLLPSIWTSDKGEDEWEVAEIASGMRVQAHRSAHGRLPIIGHLHSNVWIFTGLSSRGLLYHALFGDYLTDSILHAWKQERQQKPDSKSANVAESPVELSWWRKRNSCVKS